MVGDLDPLEWTLDPKFRCLPRGSSTCYLGVPNWDRYSCRTTNSTFTSQYQEEIVILEYDQIVIGRTSCYSESYPFILDVVHFIVLGVFQNHV
jgi:hypothetical protein